ncbi:MAG: DUF1553 domain-containing protein [Akkermansiaceae bacterium]|nr:DUF1553 domain-containing protein [Akkermansiaceae bacterium]
MPRGWILLVLLASPLLAGEPVSYAREVLPLLSDNCFLCHGPDASNREADLRLDIREAAIEAGAIVPGEPKKSTLVQRILTSDPDDIMPPPESHLTLKAGEKKLLQDWIAQGAEYERHWAFVPLPESVAVPEIKGSVWPRNSIDHFVLKRLLEEGLEPTAAASRERWLRRVSFDLTGLPPSQQELDDFLADQSPMAFETVVDRLLASPRYGERMATPWLDVARYADSFGFQADVDMHAWPYRDWVIRALNENKPFDEFLTEQLAGDLLPDATRDQRLATAFNRIHRKTNEGGSVPEEFRQEGITDRVNTVGTAFLALTMDCARCHDHKYDPITMEDFYSMGAFFNSIDEFGLLRGGQSRGTILPQPALMLPTAEQESRLAELSAKVESAEAMHQKVIRAAEAEFQQWLKLSKEGLPVPERVGEFSFDQKNAKNLSNSIKPKQKAKLGGNQLAEGKHGQGVLADGDSLTTLPDFGIKHADQPASFSLWLRPATRYERAVVFANTSSFDRPFSGYETLLEEGHVTWSLVREFPGNAISISTVDEIPAKEWTHITVTSDGSRRAAGLKIFINGREAETRIVVDNLTRDYHIGSELRFCGRGRDFGIPGGMIDEVVVHRRAITDLEARALHAKRDLADLEATTEEWREYYFSAVHPEARMRRQAIDRAREDYRKVENEVREVVTMIESEEPIPHFILERGDYTQRGKQVERITPDWLPPFPEDAPRNRLGFAQWLTMPDHPLTARVTINRIWQEIFGIGIVETSDNFGLQGAQPTHPKLLDWLARDFIESGWDQKRAIKQMVLSATYRQDSVASPELRERDPQNQLLARGPARRLTAEQLRDSALAHSGLLVETIGGPPVKPYQAPGSMWKVLNNFLPEYKRDQGDGLYRRSLYTFWRRTTTPPNMMIFDTTTRDVCATRRQSTNTPLQPLVLLNDPQYVEAARKLGERILKEGGTTDAQRARWAYREVTGRQPSERHHEILVALIEEQREVFKGQGSDAEALLGVGDSAADKSLDPVELAAFAALAQALLNLDANIMLR